LYYGFENRPLGRRKTANDAATRGAKEAATSKLAVHIASHPIGHYLRAVSQPLSISNTQWAHALSHFTQQGEWQQLMAQVGECYTRSTCYPPQSDIFRAFELTPLHHVRVVILGQDPYHGRGQANGLAFSVRAGQKAPPSLRNILQEVWDDVGGMPWVDLTRWAEQGVFLLNAALTVEEKKPGSHAKFGWERFTDEVIRTISTHQPHVVFMLWGNYAQKKEPLIDTSKHLVLQAPHPSPLSAYQGFFGCRHFSQANAFLEEKGILAVKW
jgi:uracil-DNA glycosylase